MQVRPHPSNPDREIYKFHEVVEGDKVWIYFYDRPKGSQATNSKEKHCYCKGCKKVFSGHAIDRRTSHFCVSPIANTCLSLVQAQLLRDMPILSFLFFFFPPPSVFLFLTQFQ
jgi:hypothetical protein